MNSWIGLRNCGIEPASAISGAIQGRRAGLHFKQTLFNPPRLLDVVEILQDFSKSLISNEKVVNLGVIFHFPPAPPSTKTKAAKEHHLAAFFIGKSRAYTAGIDRGNH